MPETYPPKKLTIEETLEQMPIKGQLDGFDRRLCRKDDKPNERPSFFFFFFCLLFVCGEVHESVNFEIC